MSLVGCCRLGSTLSILDFMTVGSSVSIRQYVRMGDTLSVKGCAFIDGQVNVGSALSLRAVARLGSYLSVFAAVRLGASLSVLDYAQVGSSLSVRSWGRLGSSLSVLGFAHFGSSLSLRSFARLGSSLSVFGQFRLGSTLSILDNLYLGSGLHFGTGNTYIHFDAGSSELRIIASGNKRLSLSGTGGTLHGTWASESIISASDRRLKRRVEPLHRAIAGRMPAPPPSPDHAPPTRESPASEIAALRGRRRDARSAPAAVDWLLRELRPVSFKFRDGPEAKYSRYGFVAQELEQVLPEMVRTRNEEKHVVYQDMVAVLTLASQVQQDRLASQEARAQLRRSRLDAQAQRMSHLQRSVAALTGRLTRWERLARRARRQKSLKAAS